MAFENSIYNHLKKFKLYFSICLISYAVISCSNGSSDTPEPEVKASSLTIFHINDPHGSIDNFSKIKYIVDQEKTTANVLVVSAGDIFSGNPVVDNHPDKGSPMIDLMNRAGFDMAVLGNHEFDYGTDVLKDRLQQSNFDWICANVNMNNSGIPEPFEYKTLSVSDLKVTFLGLVETNGKENDIIPLTHPWRVEELTFNHYYNIIESYASLKQSEQSDLLIALTHLGESVDAELATNYPYFDLIIGGHSHTLTNETINGIPIFQAGSYLNYLGKIKLEVKDKKVSKLNYELINLSTYSNSDATLETIIDNYNTDADLDEVLGYASEYHSKQHVGCFYTAALRNRMNADITFQNTGGIRSDLDEGDILKREIYAIDPFNNGSVTYTMTIGEIKSFLKESQLSVYYSGVYIYQQNNTIVIEDEDGTVMDDTEVLILGLNDYIPAVYDTYFTQSSTVLPDTTAELLISYLKNNTDPINYTSSNCFFKYQ